MGSRPAKAYTIDSKPHTFCMVMMIVIIVEIKREGTAQLVHKAAYKPLSQAEGKPHTPHLALNLALLQTGIPHWVTVAHGLITDSTARAS